MLCCRSLLVIRSMRYFVCVLDMLMSLGIGAILLLKYFLRVNLYLKVHNASLRRDNDKM